jgi:hypothetical protein
MTSHSWKVADPWTNNAKVREDRKLGYGLTIRETPANSKNVGATMHSVAALLTPHPDGIPRPARDVERMEGRQLSHRCQSDAQNTCTLQRLVWRDFAPPCEAKHVKGKQ